VAERPEEQHAQTDRVFSPKALQPSVSPERPNMDVDDKTSNYNGSEFSFKSVVVTKC